MPSSKAFVIYGRLSWRDQMSNKTLKAANGVEKQFELIYAAFPFRVRPYPSLRKRIFKMPILPSSEPSTPIRSVLEER